MSAYVQRMLELVAKDYPHELEGWRVYVSDAGNVIWADSKVIMINDAFDIEEAEQQTLCEIARILAQGSTEKWWAKYIELLCVYDYHTPPTHKDMREYAKSQGYVSGRT